MTSRLPSAPLLSALALVTALGLTDGALTFASDTAAKAEGQGPGAAGSPETGKPVYGGGTGCTFAYSIQKIGPTYAEHEEEVSYELIVKNIGHHVQLCTKRFARQS